MYFVLSFPTECLYYYFTSKKDKMNLLLRFELNLSVILLPAKESNELCAAFILNVPVIPLPAEELKNLMLRFIPDNVNYLLACAPEEDLCRISYQKCCPVSPLPKIGDKFRTRFVVRTLL